MPASTEAVRSIVNTAGSRRTAIGEQLNLVQNIAPNNALIRTTSPWSARRCAHQYTIDGHGSLTIGVKELNIQFIRGYCSDAGDRP